MKVSTPVRKWTWVTHPVAYALYYPNSKTSFSVRSHLGPSIERYFCIGTNAVTDAVRMGNVSKFSRGEAQSKGSASEWNKQGNLDLSLAQCGS
jgi:hypothetical protein